MEVGSTHNGGNFYGQVKRAGFSGENVVKHSREDVYRHRKPMFAEPGELWADPRTRACVTHTQKQGCVCKITSM